MRLLALYFAGLATFLPNREEMCGGALLASKDPGPVSGAAVAQGFQRAWSPFKQVVEDA